MLKRIPEKFLCLVLGLLLPSVCAIRSGEPMQVAIDCTRPQRGYIESTCVIPVTKMDTVQTVPLWYPKWVPGSHGPGGPIANVAGMTITGPRGETLNWVRTGGEVYRIEVDVPAGVATISVNLRYIINQPTTTSFGHDCFFAKSIGVVSPSCLIVYPDGVDADDDTVSVSLMLPSKWKSATALPVAEDQGETVKEWESVQYQPTSYRVLLDSPIMAGLHYQSLPLAEGSEITPPHTLHLFGDSEQEIQLNGEVVAKYREMVRQTSLLMGSHPFDRFDILLGISSQLPKNGLEHSRSTFNVLPASSLRNLGTLKGWDRLLVPHEYLHAWCGKYRRPQGMIKTDFHTAKDTELLWVYEGLTQYLGELIEARSGMMSKEEFEARLFVELRNAAHQDGRRWRTLADTGAASHILRAGSDRWGELRRSQDYYMEGMLFWLEVDARLRLLTDDKISIDEFCHRFFHVDEPLVSPKGYGRAEIISLLNNLAEYDWDGLINRRIESIQERYNPEVAGLLGYRFDFDEAKQDVPKETFRFRGGADFLDSIGVVVSRDGVVSRVKLESPADRGGLVPGDKVLTVGKKLWSFENLEQAIINSKDSKQIDLSITDDDNVRDVSLEYGEGARHYRLSRESETETGLDRILQAK